MSEKKVIISLEEYDTLLEENQKLNSHKEQITIVERYYTRSGRFEHSHDVVRYSGKDEAIRDLTYRLNLMNEKLVEALNDKVIVENLWKSCQKMSLLAKCISHIKDKFCGR